ncbi:hypothetical protein DAEQUDRAFT_742106 [Daedalea quercina L-15889]|uniref:Uncharacterized protein n=1 Tax=Daedalea quercina L-15889 TaxID=1314783 RepID=A0A165KGX3_9APHY|nr:hypothetical protein DAEQUDRAFT_742106 [Daedalea quercina L-15889]
MAADKGIMHQAFVESKFALRWLMCGMVGNKIAEMMDLEAIKVPNNDISDPSTEEDNNGEEVMDTSKKGHARTKTKCTPSGKGKSAATYISSSSKSGAKPAPKPRKRKHKPECKKDKALKPPKEPKLLRRLNAEAHPANPVLAMAIAAAVQSQATPKPAIPTASCTGIFLATLWAKTAPLLTRTSLGMHRDEPASSDDMQVNQSPAAERSNMPDVPMQDIHMQSSDDRPLGQQDVPAAGPSQQALSPIASLTPSPLHKRQHHQPSPLSSPEAGLSSGFLRRLSHAMPDTPLGGAAAVRSDKGGWVTHLTMRNPAG